MDRAAAAGLAVIIVVHQRKAEGKHGDAVRGSNALTGAVDVVVELERLRGDVDPHARVLRSESRFDETPEELALALTEDGYVARGVEATVRRDSELDRVADLLGYEAQEVADIAEAAEIARTTARHRLDELVTDGRASRVGSWQARRPLQVSFVQG